MNPLARRIVRMIEVDGPISISTFMTLTQHDRELGFYAARESIGKQGAFVTAPEISQMFGELLGLWCIACWRDQGSPAQPLLVELGPGRGTLMADLLRAVRRTPDFLDGLEVFLVEASAKLESVQRERLMDAPVSVGWAHQLDDIATGRPLFVIANEFFDALPIRQFVMTERGWCERMVTAGQCGGLMFALSPYPVPIPMKPGSERPASGAVYEVSPAAASLAENIAQRITTDGGAALVIDYGYGSRGFGDTLQAVRNHAYDDVLAAPGEADLSAHVDFAALARAVERSGARAHGPLAQSNFLRSLGVETRACQLAAANPGDADEIAAATARLTSAEAMGDLFKVIAIAPPDAPTPPGFC